MDLGPAARSRRLGHTWAGKGHANVQQWFHRVVLSRRWVTFVVMGLSFFVFGAGTLNLFMLFKSNAELLANFGWQAVVDGGLLQLVQLLLAGFASLAAYLVFKICEYRLVQSIAKDPG